MTEGRDATGRVSTTANTSWDRELVKVGLVEER